MPCLNQWISSTQTLNQYQLNKRFFGSVHLAKSHFDFEIFTPSKADVSEVRPSFEVALCWLMVIVGRGVHVLVCQFAVVSRTILVDAK